MALASLGRARRGVFDGPRFARAWSARFHRTVSATAFSRRRLRRRSGCAAAWKRRRPSRFGAPSGVGLRSLRARVLGALSSNRFGAPNRWSRKAAWRPVARLRDPVLGPGRVPAPARCVSWRSLRDLLDDRTSAAVCCVRELGA